MKKDTTEIEILNLLKENASSENITDEFNEYKIDRFRNYVYSNLQKRNQGYEAVIRKVVSIGSAFLPIIGAGMGFFVTYNPFDFSKSTQFSLWTAYIITAIWFAVFSRVLPEDIDKLRLEVKRINLLNLAERLASKLVLFSLVSDKSYSDDETLIDRISSRVTDVDNMSQSNKAVIDNCASKNFFAKSSKDTKIIIDTLSLTPEEQSKLHNIVYQIVTLAHYMFSGRQFTAKLYLHARKLHKSNEIHMLVSFAKYPSEHLHSYGSSWVKDRANSSIVWECLEKGNYIIKDEPGIGAYYDSVLAICLPGRIGVLALTSKHVNAFEKSTDKSTIKSIAVACHQLIVEALGIER